MKHLRASAAALCLAAESALGADIRPGGAVDLTLTGFVGFLAHGGQLDDARQDGTYARGLDFSNDTELQILARARDAARGLDYGATLEFNSDTDETLNTDETWIFVRGGWGEVRLGDVDGVVEESAVGAQDVAAGTGGIDGDVVDEIAVPMVRIANTSTATKARYYAPAFAGLTGAFSYTPTQQEIDDGALNGQQIALAGGDDAMQAQNVLEGGLIWDGELGEAEILASVVGLWGRLRNDAKAEFEGAQWWGWQAGATVAIENLAIGASIADEELGELGRTFVTAGIGWGSETWNASVTYGQAIDSGRASPYRNPFNLVLSLDFLLAPGLELAGDLGLFDNDGTDPDYRGGDRGWQAVGRLGVAF